MTMPVPVKIPKRGMTMTKAKIIRWMVAEGDHVKKGQPLVEIETEKTVSEIDSPADGVLSGYLLAEGKSGPVARTIAWILVNGESMDAIVLDPEQTSPESAAPRETPSAEDDGFEPLSEMRLAIAATVTKSAAIPQVVLFASADVSALMALHHQDKSIAMDDLLVSFAAKTLQHDNYLNASYEEEGIRIHPQVNVGVAVAVKKRLLIPVIRGADSLSPGQISAERKRLMDLVRSQNITEEDTSGCTFTISNLSMYPVDSFTALINPPQVAILSVGRIRQVATPTDNGGVAFRPKMTFGLTLDHRAADGAAGAVFLRHFIARIERPSMELPNGEEV